MFGLPLGTALLVFGFPVVWILYTVIFLALSRDWDRGGGEADAEKGGER